MEPGPRLECVSSANNISEVIGRKSLLSCRGCKEAWKTRELAKDNWVQVLGYRKA